MSEVEKAKRKIFQLRTLATRPGTSKEKYLRLFEKIDEDPISKQLLDYVEKSMKEKEIVKCYNNYIRNSELSDEQKDELII